MTESRRVTDEHELDARGLGCPMPILKTKKALLGLSDGEVLHVMATDKGAQKDFEAFCRQAGHALLEAEKRDGVFHFRIRKKG